MPDLTEALAAIRRLPVALVILLAVATVLAACPRAEVGARTVGYAITQGR